MPLPLPLTANTHLTLLVPQDLHRICALLNHANITHSPALAASNPMQMQHRFIAILAQQQLQQGQTLPLLCGVVDKNELLGVVLLKPSSSNRHQVTLEMGFSLAARGQGLATITCRKVRDLLFEHYQIELLLAHAHSDNQAAKRVFEKSGLGRRNKDYDYFGDGEDRSWFTIDHAQWQRTKQLAA